MTVGYPTSHDAVRDLVDDHRKLQDEPLLLAIYYAPDRDPQDIFLFEVFDGFGADQVDADRKLFEVSYQAKSTFPLQPGQSLRLVVTNVPEFERAVAEKWSHLEELRTAIRAGRYEILFSDPARPDLAGALGV